MLTSKHNYYHELVRSSTLRLNDFQNDPRVGIFSFLAESITETKKLYKVNTVEFIVAKVVNRNNHIIDIQRKSYINLFVIGSFRKEFTLTYKMSEIFATFYLETGVMPNIITISRKLYQSDIKVATSKIKNGILIYDRERGIH